MRPLVSAIRPLVLAAGVLAATAGAFELVLRVREESVGPSLLEVAPSESLCEPSRVVHHRLRPLASLTSRDPDTGEAVAISVDSHGCRGPEVAVPKPAGVYRVLCLGDEVVLGLELAESDTLAARLRELLQARTRRPVEVVNAGVPGGCPLLSSLLLKDSLLALQPDLVVLHFDMSDVSDDQRYRRRTILDPRGVPIACSHPRTVPAAKKPMWWVDCRIFGCLAGLASEHAPRGPAASTIDDPRSSTEWLRDNPPDWGLYIEQALRPIDETRQCAERIGARLIVASSPQPWQVSGDASDGPGVREAVGIADGAVLTSRAPFEALSAYLSKRGIEFCDLSADFQTYSLPTKLFFKNSAQPSRAGVELYARVLSDRIADGFAGSVGADLPQPPQDVSPAVRSNIRTDPSPVEFPEAIAPARSAALSGEIDEYPHSSMR